MQRHCVGSNASVRAAAALHIAVDAVNFKVCRWSRLVLLGKKVDAAKQGQKLAQHPLNDDGEGLAECQKGEAH